LVIYRYNLAKAVPLEGTASYAEIAASSGLNEGLCRRFIRCAIGSNIFDEDVATGRVKHTACSRQLVTYPELFDAVGFQLEDVAPAALKLPKVWDQHGQDVQEQAKSAFSFENRSDLPIFGIYAAEPERGRRFGTAMSFYAKGDSWDLRHMLTAFDWKSSEFDRQETTVIDVGGGNGQVSYFLAKETSHVRFIVQDLPNVVEVARAHIPGQLIDRVEFAAHNFFEPQVLRVGPPVNFLLRHVLHNWADEYCIQILNNLRPALQPGSKVLIYEYVLEDGPVKDLSARFGFQADMIMASLFNGQERRAKDFENIVKAADSRFAFKGVRKGPGRTMSSVIEVEWR
jgi:hypothetical protein